MNIVFVHFTTKPPKHLILNIERTIKLFPNHKVYLITDLPKSNFKIKILHFYKYEKSADWIILEKLLSHDKGFRNNFWFLSVLRFLAIADFMKYNDEEILHLESDVIISPDFPFEDFSNSKSNFLFPIVNDDQAIASCLYIKDSISAHYLKDLTITEAKRNSRTTDMHILRVLSKIKADMYSVLPSAPVDKLLFTFEDKDFCAKSSESISVFNGVFDGVDIGMFLFGQDPRNKRGFSTVRKPTPGAYLDCSKQKITMSAGRDFPYVYDFNNQKTLPIYSLHIHSKIHQLFKLSSSSNIIKNAVNHSQCPPKRYFYISIFINSLVASVARRVKSKLIRSKITHMFQTEKQYK